MTKTANLMTASAAALIAGASASFAVPQSVIDAIVSDLADQGFARIEIEIERDEIDVEAFGAGIEGDFTYSLAGLLLESDVDDDDDGYDDDDGDDRYDDDDEHDDDRDDDDRDDDDDDNGDDDEDDDGDDGDDDDGDNDDDDSDDD